VREKLEKVNVALIIGARPQIIKSMPFIRLSNEDKQVKLSIIHTGQHYDFEMTKVFFEEFSLPDPAVNLNVGSGSHAQQTAKIMTRLEPFLQEQKPDLVVVPGDTNSTLAGALTAAKLNIPVAHIEAGARSYDNRMPEEINRRLTDHCSTLLFTATENCSQNLLKEGISKDRVNLVGDTMYDVLLQQLPKAERTAILDQLDMKTKAYALLTLHRQENVDSLENLRRIVDAVVRLEKLVVIFPVHPRTRKQLCSFNLYAKLKEQKHVKLIEPVSYLENISLIKNARLVMTDSGGVQKEAFWLKTPCITLRENTEWMETVQLGANYLLGSNTERIVKTAEEIIENKEELCKKLGELPNPFGDGCASQRILKVIKDSQSFLR
jgi:UDP-N-acetylglucosamine 2-epimerase (non-hydrolysing)